MHRAKADCGSRLDASSSVRDFVGLDFHMLEEIAESGLHVAPAPSVLRLLLCPAVLGVLVFRNFFPQFTEGEGRELFKSNDSHVLYSALFSF